MPKGGASSLTPVYAGLKEDLSWFLKAFLKLKSIRFSDYKRLFQELDMIQIFNGRSNSAEIIEFNESLLVHCLPFMEPYVCPGTVRTLHERLFGLYSLYTFFYLQQDNHVVKIRVDPDAARNFHTLTEYLLQDQIYDAYMCCLKLQEDKAFKIVAFIQIYDPTFFKRFDTDSKAAGMTLCTNLNDPLSNLKTLIDSDEFLRIGIAHDEYSAKRASEGLTNKILDPINEFDRIIKKVEEEEEQVIGVELKYFSNHSSEQLCSRGMRRSEIKERAYGSDLQLSRSRRHMTTEELDMEKEKFEYDDDENEPELKEIVKKEKKMEKVEEENTKKTVNVVKTKVPVKIETVKAVKAVKAKVPVKIKTPKPVKIVETLPVKRRGRPKATDQKIQKRRTLKKKTIPTVVVEPVKKGRQTNLQNSCASQMFALVAEMTEVPEVFKTEQPELKSILRKTPRTQSDRRRVAFDLPPKMEPMDIDNDPMPEPIKEEEMEQEVKEEPEEPEEVKVEDEEEEKPEEPEEVKDEEEEEEPVYLREYYDDLFGPM